MRERVLLLTGRLAEKRLRRTMEALGPTDFDWELRVLGLAVAGLMTADLIRRRLDGIGDATRVVAPGRCRGDLDALARHYGAPFVRGPDDLKDLGRFFGRPGGPPDLSRHDVRIFAEIVEAPGLDIPAIIARAEDYRRQGADVIDLGCLPGTPFPHLGDAVRELKRLGYKVSVDSADSDELRLGARAGADLLLSLTEDTLALADETDAVPVLIPARPGELDSLLRAVEEMQRKGKNFIADPILDPIQFGFTESVMRYRDLRRRHPDVEILMGTGNLTELTDADTTGVNAVLMGIVCELAIRNVLVVRVSAHNRRAVAETDLARRIMFAAQADGALPQDYDSGLMGLRDRKPFPSTAQDIAELAHAIKDANFRVEVTADGIHVFNRDGQRVATDPFDLWPDLKLENDAAHAFYMGVETARAQIAWQLGKRYVQDRELDWGVAVERAREDMSGYSAVKSTKIDRQARKR
jgi:dihydropteroate synthase-like protein